MTPRLPLVLLHAFPLHSGLFTDLVIPDPWSVITPDRRGFGQRPLAYGDDAVPDPGMGVLVDDVVAGLDAAGADRAVVGGVSMGGYVALALAAAHPERVAGLVLIDTRAAADDDEGRAHRLAAAARADRGEVGTGRELVEPLLAPDAAPAVRERMAAIAGRAAPASIAWAQRAMAARADTTAALAALDVPVLVIVGEQDGVTPPAFAERMVAAARRAENVVIRGAGHLTPAEAPGAVSAAIGGWLADNF